MIRLFFGTLDVDEMKKRIRDAFQETMVAFGDNLDFSCFQNVDGHDALAENIHGVLHHLQMGPNGHT